MDMKYIAVGLTAALLVLVAIFGYANASTNTAITGTAATPDQGSCSSCCGGDCVSCCSGGTCSKTGATSTTGGCGCK